jgi:hypothetical protein
MMRQGQELRPLYWKTEKIYLMDCGKVREGRIDLDYREEMKNGAFIKKSHEN